MKSQSEARPTQPLSQFATIPHELVHLKSTMCNNAIAY